MKTTNGIEITEKDVTGTWSERLRTRDGRRVRILAVDLPSDYPVAAFLDGSPSIAEFRLDGAAYYDRTSPIDLVEIPRSPEVRDEAAREVLRQLIGVNWLSIGLSQGSAEKLLQRIK